jgi:2'-5' RNA ligase
MPTLRPSRRRPAVAQSLRLFFALWPDEATRLALDAWAAAMHEACGGRRIRTENLHVTLAFLGNVPLARVADLNDLAVGLDAPSFELLFDQPGYWKHNRIAWLGAAAVPIALTGLAEMLRIRLSSAGLPFDRKPYVPHVTLVRDAEPPPALPALGPVPWKLRGFGLVQSSGGRYSVLSSYALE